jgi:FkbM family methyltransferase
MLELLASIVKRADATITFRILEVGALQIAGEPEPFYKLIDLFPGSEIIGFEPDSSLCEQMNSNAAAGVKYFPFALGERNEKRPFFVTQHPMCCSLYEPNEPLISLYNNFEVAYLKYKTEVETVSLDHFSRQQSTGVIDFIKIDIQGAELDVFKGATETLKSVLAIVCEVEFIPHYVDQPLFGDVCTFLSHQNLMFHKFLGLAGRALRPIVMNGNANLPSQHIWSDAVFIRHVQQIENLNEKQLLKLSILACVYGSFDLTYYCLDKYDRMKQTSLAADFLNSPPR